MNHDAVCEALATIGRAVTGIERADPSVPDTVYPPHFYVGEIAIDWTGKTNTFAGNDDVIYLIRVLVGHSSDMDAQKLLKTFMRRTGPTSVRAAIEGTPGVAQTLGGLIDDLIVRRFQGHRMYVVGTNKYYGGEWFVQLYGSQDED